MTVDHAGAGLEDSQASGTCVPGPRQAAAVAWAAAREVGSSVGGGEVEVAGGDRGGGSPRGGEGARSTSLVGKEEERGEVGGLVCGEVKGVEARERRGSGSRRRRKGSRRRGAGRW